MTSAADHDIRQSSVSRYHNSLTLTAASCRSAKGDWDASQGGLTGLYLICSRFETRFAMTHLQVFEDRSYAGVYYTAKCPTTDPTKSP